RADRGARRSAARQASRFDSRFAPQRLASVPKHPEPYLSARAWREHVDRARFGRRRGPDSLGGGIDLSRVVRPSEARSSLRISLGWSNDAAQIDSAAETI